ncbi:MAG: hypothetical protein AMS18_03735 [Gemmatimonas sp. SG8_17]|nr:MAG: hypothetical protein AMS18_03735 [Gemmatimonas sp. SG8_17]
MEEFDLVRFLALVSLAVLLIGANAFFVAVEAAPPVSSLMEGLLKKSSAKSTTRTTKAKQPLPQVPRA